MNISKEELTRIVRNSGICFDYEDIAKAMLVAHEVLCAEADATKEKEPYATRSIEELEKAAYLVFQLYQKMEDIE